MKFFSKLRLPASTLAGALSTSMLLAGCAAESSAPEDEDGFPEESLTELDSASGALQIEVRTAPSQPPTRGSTTVELAITSKGSARDDLTVEVVPWMPDMGHGASTKPTIVDMGNGHYEISNVNMFMAGRWELQTKFEGAVDDSATVPFEIP